VTVAESRHRPKRARSRASLVVEPGTCVRQRNGSDLKVRRRACARRDRAGRLDRPPRPESPVDRFYDPTTGTFLQRDPLVSATHEAYGYTGGNPLNLVDPSGLDWSCIANPGSCDLPIPDSWEEALGSETAHHVRTAAVIVAVVAVGVACVFSTLGGCTGALIQATPNVSGWVLGGGLAGGGGAACWENSPDAHRNPAGYVPGPILSPGEKLAAAGRPNPFYPASPPPQVQVPYVPGPLPPGSQN
jgi:hypothetical protein